MAKTIFYVDLPNPFMRQGYKTDDDTWKNVGIFLTRRKAENFLMKHWGVRRDQADVFIIEGEDP